MNEKRGTVSSKNNTFRARRAQASMEYLMIAGIAFVIIVPMMYILYQYTSDLNKDVTDSKVGKIGTDIANTAEQIFYLGSPSRTTLRFDMPDGVYDMEVTGDRTIIFRLGDPSSPKEVTTFANVDIISYLVPDDFTKGRKNLKIEAERDHVVLYTGDKETALLRYGAYSIFKELMKGAELVYGQTRFVAGSGNSWAIKDNNPGDKAYIGTLSSGFVLSDLNNLDISADVKFNSITDTPIYFTIGKYDTVNDIFDHTLEIIADKIGGETRFSFEYGGNVLLPTNPAINDMTLFPEQTYRLRIKKDSSCSAALCGADVTVPHYQFIISDTSDNPKAVAYVAETDLVPGLSLSQWFFGDLSTLDGMADASIKINFPTNFVPSDITSFEERSSATTKQITTSITITQLDINSNSVSFVIDTGKLDETKIPPEEITIPISFHSYYPLTNVIPLLEDYSNSESCFKFTLMSGFVTIEKVSC